MSEIEKMRKQFADLSPKLQKEAQNGLEELFKQANEIDWESWNSRWKILEDKETTEHSTK